MKLKTKITYSFDIESEIADTMDFNFDVPIQTMKKRAKIIEVKATFKNKKNGNSKTRLF